MRKTKLLIAAGVAAALPLAALAYSHGKPGLWEVTTQMNFTKGGPPAMPQIPPEQLQKMQQMGIKVPSGMGGGPMTSSICVTPEQANSEVPPANTQHSCQMQNLKHSGHTYAFDMVCSGEMSGAGHGSVTYDSDEHYSGKMQFSGSNAHTGAVEMNNEFSGQFKSADCGAVKPFTAPK